MKAIVMSLLCLVGLSQGAWAADQGQLKVHVDGLKNNNGVVRIALYNSAQAFSEDKGGHGQEAFAKEIAQISGNQSDCVFANVPYGSYAIKLFHDEDNSGKIVTNMLGMPKVQFGFSNNAKGSFGPPPFDKAAFKVNSAETTMNITVQN
ncbi:MAG: DUF2141 domain-containing protein [Candidatus Obscuribacterales bacterium]|nr:DUF2141 domain-containing protein [Candidatus Obscuribacterales bacterium]